MNTEKLEEKSISRSNYYKNYYLQNKEKIARRKEQRKKSKVTRLFSSDTNQLSFKQRLRSCGRVLELVFLFALIAAITSFLVKEAAGFYLESNEAPIWAYLKAGAIEAVAILFSFSRGKSFMLRWSQRVLVILLCGLTLGTMSGKLIKSASGESNRTQLLQKTIRDLETERSQKESLRQELLGRKWLKATRKYDRSIDEIRQKIATARESLASSQDVPVVWNTLAILIAFRLLLVASNLIAIHRIVEAFGESVPQKSSPLTLVST